MATNEQKILDAIKKLRKTDKKRNFDQTIDLIINLKGFDVRREAFSLFIEVPHKIKDRKIAGFFETKSDLIDTIKKDEFDRFKGKKDFRKLIKGYDFFVAGAKLMPTIATKFGRILGPAGKMPSPQLGIVPVEDDNAIQTLIEKINATVKVKVKEPSLKLSIGKESLTDEQIMENGIAVYDKILETLPRKRDNIKNVLIKFSMDKPVKIEL